MERRDRPIAAAALMRLPNRLRCSGPTSLPVLVAGTGPSTPTSKGSPSTNQTVSRARKRRRLRTTSCQPRFARDSATSPRLELGPAARLEISADVLFAPPVRLRCQPSSSVCLASVCHSLR